MVCCPLGYLDNIESPAEGIQPRMKYMLSTESDGVGSSSSVFHGTTTIATLLGTFDQNPGQDN
jgi:hypothetical protein